MPRAFLQRVAVEAPIVGREGRPRLAERFAGVTGASASAARSWGEGWRRGSHGRGHGATVHPASGAATAFQSRRTGNPDACMDPIIWAAVVAGGVSVVGNVTTTVVAKFGRDAQREQGEQNVTVETARIAAESERIRDERRESARRERGTEEPAPKGPCAQRAGGWIRPKRSRP
jgi:hypothetical protein